MTVLSLIDANIAIVAMCNERKQALERLFHALDQYTKGSLSPDEHDKYNAIKIILIERHSQHENS